MDPPPRPKNRPQTLKQSESTEFDFGIKSSKDVEESQAPPPKPAHRPGRKIGILPAEPEEPQFRTATDLQARLESLDTQGAASNPEAIALFKETADKLDAEGPGGPTSRALHYPFLGPGAQKVSPEDVPEKPSNRPKLESKETYEREFEDAGTELADAREEMRLKSELETPNARSKSEPQIDSEEAPASKYTELAQEIEEAREEFDECKREKELRDSLEPEEDVFDVEKELDEDPQDAEVIHKEYKEGLDAKTVEEIRKAEEVRLAKEELAREKCIKGEVVDAPPMDEVAEHEAAVRERVQKELPVNEDLDLTVIPEVDETPQEDALSAASEPAEPKEPTVAGETLEKPPVKEKLREEVSSDQIAPPKPSKRPTKSEEKKIPETDAISAKTEEKKPEAETSGPPPKPTKRPSKPISDDELIAPPKSPEGPSEGIPLESSEATPEETPEKGSAQKIEKLPLEEPSKASFKSPDSGGADAKKSDEEDTKAPPSVTEATSEPARSQDKKGTEAASQSLASSSDIPSKTAPPKPAKRPTRTNTESSDVASDVASPVTDSKDADAQSKDLPPKPAKPARRPTEEAKVKPKPPKPKSALASRFEAVLKEHDAPKPKPVLKPKPKPASSGFSARFADLNAALSRPPTFKESKEATETQEAALLDEHVNKSVDTNESADAQLKAMPRNPRARGPKLGAKRRLPSSVTAPKTTLAIVVASAPVWEIAELEDDSDTGPLTIVAPAHTEARRSEPEIDTLTKLELESAIRHSIDPNQVAISDLQPLPHETVGALASAEPKGADIPALSSLLDHVPDTTLDPEEETFNPPKLSLSFDDLVAEGEPGKSAQGTPSLGVNLSKYLDKSPQSADMRPEDQEYFEIPIKKKPEAAKQETKESNPDESNPEESKSEVKVDELEPESVELEEPESELKSEDAASEKVNVGESTIEEKVDIEKEQFINTTETETEKEAELQI